MAQKKAYSRYFIILQQDENGYSLSADKLPSGYAKLETKNDKCKISYYVQNLKKEMEPYQMVLICSKKDTKKLIKLGTMNIDDYGRTEITHEYSSGDIAGSGVSIDMITGAAVIKYVDSSIISVMSGFATTDAPGDWRTYDVYDVERVEQLIRGNQEDSQEDEVEAEVVPEPDVIEITEMSETPQVSEIPEVNEEKSETKNIFQDYEEMIEANKVQKNRNVEVTEQLENNEENLEAEEPIQADKKDVEDGTAEIKVEAEKQVKQTEGVGETSQYRGEDYPNGTVGEFFKIVAEDFEETQDICNEIKRCRWYRVKVDSMDDMCNTGNYNKYTIAYYPMLNYYPYIKRHGHYLLGYKFDTSGKMKYLVYGIPGTKNRSDQPYGGKSGFVTWVSLKEDDMRDDSDGYWLMFYDFRTSTIVIPVK